MHSILKDVGFSWSSALCSLLLIVCFILIKRILVRKFSKLPGINLRCLDILGDLKNMPRNIHTENEYWMFNNLLQVFGAYAHLFRKNSLFCFWVSYTPYIVCVKAQAVEDLISGTKTMEKAWTYSWLHPWLGTGLLTSHGSKWKSRRKLLTPCFHFDILKDFIPVFNEQSQILVENFRKETEKPWIDIVKPVTLCTLDIICETTLGVNVGAQKNSESEYVTTILRVSTSIMYRMLHPQYYFDWIFRLSKFGRQFKKDVDLLHSFTKSVIQEKKEKLVKGNAPNVYRKRKALMDLLLEEHMKNQNLSEEDIREEVDTFAFEGHDTTSMGISWTLYLIGLHKDVQDSIHEELNATFGDDVERPITTDDLKEMKYLECVLKESQRIFPSVPMIGRQAKETITLNGYNIPKGAACIVNTYELHRDPDVFPNPEKFDPDRFLPENSVNRHPFAYIPFSAGPRNCIGQRFAMMEQKIVVANILRNYILESLEQRDEIVPTPEVILRSAQPIKIKIKPRYSLSQNRHL